MHKKQIVKFLKLGNNQAAEILLKKVSLESKINILMQVASKEVEKSIQPHSISELFELMMFSRSEQKRKLLTKQINSRIVNASDRGIINRICLKYNYNYNLKSKNQMSNFQEVKTELVNYLEENGLATELFEALDICDNLPEDQAREILLEKANRRNLFNILDYEKS